MNQKVYDVALKDALTEFQNVCQEVKWSFIFTNDGTIISGNNDQKVDPEIKEAASTFQNLTEKSEAVGGLDQVLINGDKERVHISSIEDMYLVSGISKQADIAYMHSVTSIVFPTILRVLKKFDGSIGETSPTPLKSFPSRPLEKVTAETHDEKLAKLTEEIKKEKTAKPLPSTPSKQLIVDMLGGLLVRADTVEVDSEILKRWSTLLGVKEIEEVEIETFGGKMAQCKVKMISDHKLEGKGLVRIPNKTCKMLETSRGELVRIKPIVQEK